MVKKDDYHTGFKEGYEEAVRDSKLITKNEFAKLVYLLGQDGFSDHKSVGILVWKLSDRVKDDDLWLEEGD